MFMLIQQRYCEAIISSQVVASIQVTHPRQPGTCGHILKQLIILWIALHANQSILCKKSYRTL